MDFDFLCLDLALKLQKRQVLSGVRAPDAAGAAIGLVALG
jgi:hypothetical protein